MALCVVDKVRSWERRRCDEADGGSRGVKIDFDCPWWGISTTALPQQQPIAKPYSPLTTHCIQNICDPSQGTRGRCNVKAGFFFCISWSLLHLHLPSDAFSTHDTVQAKTAETKMRAFQNIQEHTGRRVEYQPTDNMCTINSAGKASSTKRGYRGRGGVLEH